MSCAPLCSLFTPEALQRQAGGRAQPHHQRRTVNWTPVPAATTPAGVETWVSYETGGVAARNHRLIAAIPPGCKMDEPPTGMGRRLFTPEALQRLAGG